MPAIAVDVSGDHEACGRKAGVNSYPIVHTTADWTIDILDKGMQSGATSLMLMIPADVTYDDDGSVERVLLMIETSLTAWMMASTVIAAHCRDEVEKPGWAVLPQAARDLLAPRYVEAIRRCIPSATQEQVLEAAEMMFDSLGADQP